MPRLMALCELYVSKEVEKATTQSIAQADVDVVGTLSLPVLCLYNNIAEHVHL